MQSMALVVVMAILSIGAVFGQSPPSPAPPIPMVLTVNGTRREVAFQIGAQTKHSLAVRLARADVKDGLMPFIRTTNGTIIFQEMVSRVAAVFPQLIEEMKWLARGSGHSFDEIFVLNALQELEFYFGVSSSETPHPPTMVAHCTDVLAQPRTGVSAGIWGHNEDAEPGDQYINYFVNATIYADNAPGQVEERFLAYSYAGTVGGLAYGWNYHGLAMSENAIFATKFNFLGIPASILGRAILMQSSIDDVIKLVRTHHGCNSFNLNLGEFPSGRLTTLESDPFNFIISPREIFNLPAQRMLPGLGLPPTSFVHTNIFQTLTSACYPDESSSVRLRTLAKYPAPTSTADIARMLGDTSNASFPVYRHNSPTDPVATLTTAVWDLQEGVVRIYNDNPALTEPIFVWSMMF